MLTVIIMYIVARSRLGRIRKHFMKTNIEFQALQSAFSNWNNATISR